MEIQDILASYPCLVFLSDHQKCWSDFLFFDHFVHVMCLSFRSDMQHLEELEQRMQWEMVKSHLAAAEHVGSVLLCHGPLAAPDWNRAIVIIIKKKLLKSVTCINDVNLTVVQGLKSADCKFMQKEMSVLHPGNTFRQSWT